MKNFAMTGIIFATLVLAFGYATGDQWILAFIIIGLGLLWLVTEWQDWSWFAAIGLAAFIGFAALGIKLELSTVWMLVSVVAALAAWDLARFSRRVIQTEPSGEGVVALQKPHFRRLLIVGGLGLLLAEAALRFQIDLNFGWAVLLGLLMTVSLSWVVGSIRRSSE